MSKESGAVSEAGKALVHMEIVEILAGTVLRSDKTGAIGRTR